MTTRLNVSAGVQVGARSHASGRPEAEPTIASTQDRQWRLLDDARSTLLCTGSAVGSADHLVPVGAHLARFARPVQREVPVSGARFSAETCRFSLPSRDSRGSIPAVHAHVVLMLAATALIGLFVVIVVAVTTLQRRGRLGAPDRRIEFGSYGPILAAACSGGAAAVHLAVVGEHAALTAADASPDAIALLCSIGAGQAHFAGADPALAGFLPLGMLSVGMIGAQGALAVPRIWRNRPLLLGGLAITLVALGTALLSRLLAPAGGQQIA